MNVDEARRYYAVPRIDDDVGRTGGNAGLDGDNTFVLDRDIGQRRHLTGTVDNHSAAYKNSCHPPSTLQPVRAITLPNSDDRRMSMPCGKAGAAILRFGASPSAVSCAPMPGARSERTDPRLASKLARHLDGRYLHERMTLCRWGSGHR